MKNTPLILSLILALFTLSACGKGSASAKLKFSAQESSNSSSARLSNGLVSDPSYSASTFKMKLIAAYLSESIDPLTQNNTGNVQMIWVNPECNDDLMHCNISRGTAEDGQPWSNIVSSFFNFSNSAIANQLLNEQVNEISTGKYRYVRLEFCKTNPEGVNNVEWSSDEVGITNSQSFRIDQCGVNSKVMDPPLEVKDQDLIQISLSYSLADLVKQQNYNSTNCVNGYCFQLPSFTPSATIIKQ